jgi:hypothetical protein
MARKYKCGERIKSVADYESKSQFLTYFMVHGRTTHKGWIESWQYRMLKRLIDSGSIYEALPIDFQEENKDEKE